MYTSHYISMYSINLIIKARNQRHNKMKHRKYNHTAIRNVGYTCWVTESMLQWQYFVITVLARRIGLCYHTIIYILPEEVLVHNSLGKDRSALAEIGSFPGSCSFRKAQHKGLSFNLLSVLMTYELKISDLFWKKDLAIKWK